LKNLNYTFCHNKNVFTVAILAQDALHCSQSQRPQSSVFAVSMERCVIILEMYFIEESKKLFDKHLIQLQQKNELCNIGKCIATEAQLLLQRQINEKNELSKKQQLLKNEFHDIGERITNEEQLLQQNMQKELDKLIEIQKHDNMLNEFDKIDVQKNLYSAQLLLQQQQKEMHMNQLMKFLEKITEDKLYQSRKKMLAVTTRKER
jgi:hypothetical protein